MRWRYEKWVKLYVREEGSFAQLPLYVRALAGELLKICDQDGRISLRGKEPWLAIAFQLGADPSDRRLLRKHIPTLIADGYLEHAGDDLIVRNFTVAQTGVDRFRGPDKDPAKTESDATDARVENEPCTSQTRAVHEPCTTSESSNDNQAGLSRRSDIIDLQDIRERAARPSYSEQPAVQASRRSTATAALHRLNALRISLAAELGIGQVMGIPIGLTTPDGLVRRLGEAGTLEAGELQLHHVFAVAEAEARAKRSVQWLTVALFDEKPWRRLLGMTVEDARRVDMRRGQSPAEVIRPRKVLNPGRS